MSKLGDVKETVKKVKKAGVDKRQRPTDESHQHSKDVKKTSKHTSKDDIDDLFGQLKGSGAKKNKIDVGTSSVAAVKSKQAPAPKIIGNKDDIFGTDVGKSRKRTEEGYAIYTEDELGLGKKGGNTDKCPFDCDCCF